MGLRYKKPLPIERLKEAGYTSYKLKQMGNPISMGAMTRLRHGEGISWKTLETICALCGCQPGDLIEYVPEEEGKENNGEG